MAVISRHLKPDDREALSFWDSLLESMENDFPIDIYETEKEQKERKAKLEGDFEEWKKYYFPNYCTHDAPDFHKRSSKKILSEMEFYMVRPWSRELSKSGLTMMEVLYLTLTGKKKNVILTSNTKDNAIRLLEPYKSNLETNVRIINDYGQQEKHGAWTEAEFTTLKGVTFRAIGAGQSPRGTRSGPVRPDILLIDDFDEDEDSIETVAKKWKWLEGALYATRSISRPLTVIYCGNIIAEDSCITRAIKMADESEIVNILDEDGNSTWPEKNTDAMIRRVLSKISYITQQREYFNNPIVEGTVFKKLHYKKMKPLKEYKFLVAYTDPSYKSGKKNDYKATCLVGRWKDEYHVLRMYCARTTTAEMIDWQYQIMRWVNGRTPVYFMIEWPSIDEGLRTTLTEANKKHKITLPLAADPRTKPDKFHRIESLLEPLNREEKLWFNKDIKDSDHMETTESQFLALSATSRAHDDAPDAVEGGVFDLNRRTASNVALVQAIPVNMQNQNLMRLN